MFGDVGNGTHKDIIIGIGVDRIPIIDMDFDINVDSYMLCISVTCYVHICSEGVKLLPGVPFTGGVQFRPFPDIVN